MSEASESEASESKIERLQTDRRIPGKAVAEGQSNCASGCYGEGDSSARYGTVTVDLGAIQRNWQSLRRTLGSDTECGAVIKANAYGLGAGPVSRVLYAGGCRSYFVATVDEGITARRHLEASAEIYVLGGFRPGGEIDCVTHRLIPVLFTLEQMHCWRSVSSRNQAPCAIKIDTGMTRLGLDVEMFYHLCQERQLLLECHPTLFMSHLACADDSSHPQNMSQLQCFQRAAKLIRSLIPGIRLSLANSSGICLGTDWHFDLVRPGAAIYGVNPQPGKANIVEHVVQLHLPIIQVRDIRPGASVGYGATYKVARPSRLAVVMGGYADGIHRTLGNRRLGLLAGIQVPVAGRISMDSTSFDITEVPSEQVPEEGRGSIQLLGDQLTVDDVGAAGGTLGYEVLTSLGDRYQHRYINSVAD